MLHLPPQSWQLPVEDVTMWTHEHGYITDKAKQAIENRAILTDDALLEVWRELNAMIRLLEIEVFLSNRSAEFEKLASHATINYLQTPIHQHGYIPPLELTLQLACHEPTQEATKSALDEAKRLLEELT